MNLFFFHPPGCTSEKPCRYCETSKFLLEKLSPEDLETFRTRLFGDYRVLEIKVETLDLLPRVKNILKGIGVVTIADLIQKKEEELINTPNLGRRSLNEIKELLWSYGLTLGSHL